MAKVAVVGVGAIGGVVAGWLQQARQEITLCTRRPLPALKVLLLDGSEIAVTARNLTEPTQAEPMDWVLVTMKTYDTAGARQWLQKLVGKGTRVAVIQNGVEHRERFAPEFDVLPVIIDTPAERRGDDLAVQRGAAVMHVADDAAGRAFAGLFGAAAEVRLTDDFLTAAWRKLCLNSAGVLSALTLKPAGVLQDELMGKVALDLIAECVAVGRAVGAKLEDGIGERVLAGYRAGPADSVNSLLADRRAGRQTEIEARNGVIVRMGEKHGIATPTNRMALALMLAM